MKKVNVYEDNGGGLHAIVMDDGNPTNILSGFEDRALSTAEFIEEARTGFVFADEYDPSNYSDLTLRAVADEIEESDDLIATITAGRVELNLDKMGYAGKILFGASK